MPKKKTQVLCTVPLPIPMSDGVEILRCIETALKGHTVYVRNGVDCLEIFRYAETKENDDNEIDTLPGLRESAVTTLPDTQLPKKEKT